MRADQQQEDQVDDYYDDGGYVGGGFQPAHDQLERGEQANGGQEVPGGNAPNDGRGVAQNYNVNYNAPEQQAWGYGGDPDGRGRVQNNDPPR